MLDMFSKVELKEELKIKKKYKNNKTKRDKAIKKYRGKLKAKKEK